MRNALAASTREDLAGVAGDQGPMLVNNYLAGPRAFLRGLARTLDLGNTLTPVAAGWPEPLRDDAAALWADWEALAGDRRRAYDKLVAELGGTFHGTSP